jgi:Outer membrane protein and related peptidoglycan-associated (lipo)proteins
MRMCLALWFMTWSSVLSGQEVSARYELVKMDKTVNTFRHEAAPVVSPDGKSLYFFVQNHPDNTHGKNDTQDIWASRKDEQGVWSPAEHLTNPFNIHPSNQVFTVLPDGSIFIKGGRRKGQKGFSIVTAGKQLIELEVNDFDKMNKGRFYGATMSADKKHIIIYFSEKDNSPISDLYASHLQGDGSYSQPAKLKLSTSTDEVGPFIDPDQKTLYFGSARQAPGRQGGVDIYKSARLDDSWMNWSEPVNLGKPINTSALDFYFTVDSHGNIFTSRANKALEGAQLDLYMLVPKTFGITLAGNVYNQKTNDPLQADVEIRLVDSDALKLRSDAGGLFESKISEVSGYSLTASLEGYLPASASAKLPMLFSDTTIYIDIPLVPIAKALVLKGDVIDNKTNEKIAAKLEMSLKESRIRSQKINASNGSYEQEIQELGWYIFTASAEGYLNAVDSVWVNDKEVTPVIKDIVLQPIEVGVTVRLKNIYFDFDKTTLKNESFTELNKVVDFLKQNPSVEIEISGHTDNKGSDDYNQTLSQGRSEAVVDYVISQGIDSYRLTAHGYGEGKPIDTNDSEDGRANNRRVEFTVMKK